MGILRFLLAVSVIIAHSSPIFGSRFVGGPLAVQSFYMISGFYMALILSEKYIGLGAIKKFYLNRFLRIYPIYWVVLLLTFVISIVMLLRNGNPFMLLSYVEYWPHFQLPSLLLLGITNLTIFGQDAVMFSAIKDGFLSFSSNFWLTNPQVYKFLLIPQAWTISIELMFYLLAPWLNKRKTKTLTCIIVGSFIMRKYFESKGFNHDPWTYRFFPFEIMFFLFGILSYRFHSLYKNAPHSPAQSTLILFTVFGLTILYPFLQINESMKQVFYLIFIGSSLPVLFQFASKTSWDRIIGELSYPLYISHWLIIDLMNIAFDKLHTNQFLYSGSIAVILTTFFSIIIWKTFTTKIETVRIAISKVHTHNNTI